jgi:CRISP-associated protein Cas1
MQLVINTYGSSLQRHQDRFLILAGNRRAEYSAHKVQSILITTSVSVTTDALELAVCNKIDVVFLQRDGDPFARIWQTSMGSTAAIRRRQLAVAETGEGLALACGWIGAKLQHQVEFLEELGGRRPHETDLFESTLGTVRGCHERVGQLTGTLDEQRGSVMGLEGSAGRAYFGCLGQLVPENFRFSGRSRQPAQDGFNAALNYCYGVLYSLVEKACICAGLDPHVGFLHTDNYSKKSLVFDLIEPFRIIADRTVLLVFTGRRAQTAFFDSIPGGVALSKEGRAFIIEQLQRDVIRHESHGLANTLLGRNDMPRVVETENLWAEETEEKDESVSIEEDEER